MSERVRGGGGVNDIMLTKQSWVFGLMVASLEMFAIALICYLRLVIELFRRREYVLGVILAVLFVFVGGGWTVGLVVGLPIGWLHALRGQIRAWLAVWSIALVAGIANLLIAIWMSQMTKAEWTNWFGWVPPF
jgi:hypothetical protein